MLRIFFIFLFTLTLIACASSPKSMTPKQMSELQQGQRLFEAGFYKRSMTYLLPLAGDGNAEAQYAVGYMYYYGYGVAQDTNVGYYWVKRAADQHYAPAQHALTIIEQNPRKPVHADERR